MIRNLLRTAVRHLSKHPGYTVLNLLGLTLGITSALFLIIYVSDEISYDRYHEKADRIYRVSSHISERDDDFTWIVAQIPFGPQAAQDYPEIQSFVRFIPFQRVLCKNGEIEYNEEDFFYTDSTLFDIFTYKVLKGDVKPAMTDPNKIVLTKKIASRYFGNSDPVGKTLIAGDRTFEVTGVIEDVPSNSHFRFDAVASRNNLPKQMGSWGNFGVSTYLLFPENFDVKTFETKMQGMYERYMKQIFGPVSVTVQYILEPIKKIHLYSTNANEPEPTGSVVYVKIFAIVAIFLIMIAAMNYMNLSTARSAGRAREVGLRKVVGSRRNLLISQFLAESVVLVIISLILSIALLAALLPKFNLLAGKSFGMQVIFSPAILASLLIIIIIAGVVGGSYPAFFLSKFKPVNVLKGEVTKGSAGSTFRKILVMIQFTVSVAMIICTLVVFRQLKYMKTADQGFDQQNIISLEFNDRAMSRKYQSFKGALQGTPGIVHVTATDTPVGEGSAKLLFNVETDQGMASRGINFAIVDHDFIETMGIKMLKGRDFEQDMPSDTLQGVVVNETFVKRMGWADPIGKKIEAGNESVLRARVIGVMQDYHQTGMYNEIESLLLAYRTVLPVVYIKLDGTNNAEAITAIEKQWKEFFPGQPFTYTYLTERFNRQFEADEKRGFVFELFTILAIFIACLGLFGLASYMVEQRTKEIGIRKVYGADEMTVLRLISRDFLLLVCAGIAVAIPIAYYFMGNWLENYVYRTTIGIGVIVLAALVTIVLTFLTISFKAYQAAVMNPANSIRTE
ncbi:MAG TPA: ABC transporter permease [Bacteroidales bacterium]|nr:ABC transporter permease [Bacteroidales bacterium]